MTYRVLLFDADGTLLDFKKSEEAGLTEVFKEFQIPDKEACRSYYLALNERLWAEFEKGEFPRQHIFDVRFQMVLDHFHLPGDGAAMEHRYREWLNQGSHIIPGAYELIEQLAKQYELYIVTNGVSKTQHLRLSASGLQPFFHQVFVSEDIGYQKPQKEYFDYVLSHIHADPTEMLLIGDSLSSDIIGANHAGIASCWYNPDQTSNDSRIKATYEIQHLEDLWKIL